jgi:hypothetical protein
MKTQSELALRFIALYWLIGLSIWMRVNYAGF